MMYHDMYPATFIERPNRFIAHCELDGRVEICHVKNTGRCKELLLPGVPVYLQKASNPKRSTPYDLIAVQKGPRLINMDAQAPNTIFREWAEAGGIPGLTLLRPETVYGKSRFDFYIEAGDRRIFVEVKGVTLEEEGIVRFPDAPTERGVKHVKELCHGLTEGYEALLVFIIQMEDVRFFTPNDATDPAFGTALREAHRQGVKLLALECEVTPERIEARRAVDIRL